MPADRRQPEQILHSFSILKFCGLILVLSFLIFARLGVEMLGPSLFWRDAKRERAEENNEQMPTLKQFEDRPHYGAFLNVAKHDFLFVAWSVQNRSFVQPSDALLIYQTSQMGHQHEMPAGFAGEIRSLASLSPGEEVAQGRPLALIGHPSPKATSATVGLVMLLSGCMLITLIAASRASVVRMVLIHPSQMNWHWPREGLAVLRLQEVATGEPEDDGAQQAAAAELMVTETATLPAFETSGTSISPQLLTSASLPGASSRARTPSPLRMHLMQRDYHDSAEKEHHRDSHVSTPRERP